MLQINAKRIIVGAVLASTGLTSTNWLVIAGLGIIIIITIVAIALVAHENNEASTADENQEDSK